MRRKLTVLAVGLAAIFMGCRQEPVAQPLAMVGDRPISRSGFHRYLERKPTVLVIVEGARGLAEARVAHPLGLQALRDLVNRELLLQIAEQEKLLPTDQEVDNELALRKKNDAQFVARLEEKGLSADEIRNDLTIDMITERLWTQGIEVEDLEVQRYIDDHPEEFVVPAQAELRWIVVDSDVKKSAVDASLSKGNAFEKVAEQYSVLPGTGEQKSRFPEKRIDRLPPRVQKLVRDTPVNKATPWFQDGARWVKLWVVTKTESRKLTIDDSAKARIHRLLAIRKGRTINDLEKHLRNALGKTKVSINDRTLDRLWKESM